MSMSAGPGLNQKLHFPLAGKHHRLDDLIVLPAVSPRNINLRSGRVSFLLKEPMMSTEAPPTQVFSNAKSEDSYHFQRHSKTLKFFNHLLQPMDFHTSGGVVPGA